MYKRILLKISGEALSSATLPLCFDTIDRTAGELALLHKLGIELGVVVGGGNIMRGRAVTNQDRNRADNMGMLATAINALALEDALTRLGVPVQVLSAVSMERFCDSFSARAAVSALESGKVVIFACGTGCPFFSTDTAAALRAAEIGAEALCLAKNIDAVYSCDPKLNPDAVRYEHLSYDKVIEDSLNATDLTCITLCRERGIPIKLFALSEMTRFFKGEQIGTLID